MNPVDLIGVWRVVAFRRDGRDAVIGITHRVFAADGQTWAVLAVPAETFADEVQKRSRWALIETGIELATEYVEPNGNVRHRETRRLPLVLDAGRLSVDLGSLGILTLIRERAEAPDPPVPPARPTLEIDGLGELALDAPGQWSATIQIGGKEVRLVVEEGTQTNAMLAIEPIIRGVFHKLPELREYAAAELLGLYNADWRGSSPTCTAAQFVAALRVTAIALEGDGGIEVLFEDGGLFGEHGVTVLLGADLRPREAFGP